MARIEPRTHTLKNGQAVLVRTAEPSDAGRVLAILDAVVTEGNYTLAEPGEGATIAQHAEHSGDLFLVAEVAGDIAGWISFESDRLRRTMHRGELSIFLDPRWREQGAGTALLGELLVWATAHPMIEKVALAVFSTNERAIGLYRKLGFVEEGRCPGDMKLAEGRYVDSVLMYRFVAGDHE